MIKPVTTIVMILLMVMSAEQLLRLIFQVEIVIGGIHMPLWLSIFGFMIPLPLAFMLWRESRN